MKKSPFEKLNAVYRKTYSLDRKADSDFFDCVKQVYFSPEVQSLVQYPQHDKMNRLQHITSVAYLTFRICKRFGLDYEKAANAAVMHDLFYYDWHENDWSHRPHGYRHPAFAAANAKTLCGDKLDKKSEMMILRHMWPLTPMPPSSLEGLVLSLSDKYCASREMKIAKQNAKNVQTDLWEKR